MHSIWVAPKIKGFQAKNRLHLSDDLSKTTYVYIENAEEIHFRETMEKPESDWSKGVVLERNESKKKKLLPGVIGFLSDTCMCVMKLKLISTPRVSRKYH